MDMMKNELSVLKEKELILDSSEQNCVRLMNLHKAKGLEGNIVIMAEAKNHKFSGGKYTDLVAKRQVYVPLKTSDYSYMDYLTFYPNERKQAEDKYFGEQLRLEYVAATRAKQAFIFVYTFERKKTCDRQTYNEQNRQRTAADKQCHSAKCCAGGADKRQGYIRRGEQQPKCF